MNSNVCSVAGVFATFHTSARRRIDALLYFISVTALPSLSSHSSARTAQQYFGPADLPLDSKIRACNTNGSASRTVIRDHVRVACDHARGSRGEENERRGGETLGSDVVKPARRRRERGVDTRDPHFHTHTHLARRRAIFARR